MRWGGRGVPSLGWEERRWTTSSPGRRGREGDVPALGEDGRRIARPRSWRRMGRGSCPP